MLVEVQRVRSGMQQQSRGMATIGKRHQRVDYLNSE